MMDYESFLKNYLNRRVCLELNRRCALWGTLATICDDSLRLLNTLLVRDPDDQGWFEQMQHGNGEEPAGPTYPETVVRIEDVLAVTCVDDDIPQPEPPAAPVVNRDNVTSLRSAPRKLVPSNEGLSKTLQRLSTGLKISTQAKPPENEKPEIDKPKAEEPTDAIVDRFGLELGVGLVKLADSSWGGDLLSRVSSVRRNIAHEIGIHFPKLRIRDNISLGQRTYRFLVNGHEVAGGEIYPDALMMLDLDGAADEIPGMDFREPAFGHKAKWIEEAHRDRAEILGATVCEPNAVLATHLAEIVKTWAHELLSCEHVKEVLDWVAESNPTVVSELTPGLLPIAVLHRLLAQLLEERVTIRNIVPILESLAFFSRNTSSIDTMLKQVRIELRRDICRPLAETDNVIRAITISCETEAGIRQQLADGRRLGDSPLIEQLAVRMIRMSGPRVLTVTDGDIRRPLFAALAHRVSRASVLAAAEIPREFMVASADDSDENESDDQ